MLVLWIAGRAGHSGTAITLFSLDNESFKCELQAALSQAEPTQPSTSGREEGAVGGGASPDAEEVGVTSRVVSSTIVMPKAA